MSEPSAVEQLKEANERAADKLLSLFPATQARGWEEFISTRDKLLQAVRDEAQQQKDHGGTSLTAVEGLSVSASPELSHDALDIEQLLLNALASKKRFNALQDAAANELRMMERTICEYQDAVTRNDIAKSEGNRDSLEQARQRAYRTARIYEPSMDGYNAAIAVYEAAFGSGNHASPEHAVATNRSAAQKTSTSLPPETQTKKET